MYFKIWPTEIIYKIIRNNLNKGSEYSLINEKKAEQCAHARSLTAPESMFMLSLNRTDRIRLLAAPPEVIHLVAKAVHQVRKIILRLRVNDYIK